MRTATSRGDSTTSLNTTSYGEVLDWEFAGAFEAYGVDTCNQYPASGQITFRSISVQRANGSGTQPAWMPWTADGWQPGCLTHVGTDPDR